MHHPGLQLPSIHSHASHRARLTCVYSPVSLPHPVHCHLLPCRITLCAATPCVTSWRRRCGPTMYRPRPPRPSCLGSTCWRTPRRECPAVPGRARSHHCLAVGQRHMPWTLCVSSLVSAPVLPFLQLPPQRTALHPLQLEAEPELPGLRLHRPAGAAGQADLAGAPAPPDGRHAAGPARGESLLRECSPERLPCLLRDMHSAGWGLGLDSMQGMQPRRPGGLLLTALLPS